MIRINNDYFSLISKDMGVIIDFKQFGNFFNHWLDYLILFYKPLTNYNPPRTMDDE